MRSMRLTLCAGAVVAAAFTPVAYAAELPGDSAGGVSVTPASPAPGGDIQVRASGCTGRTATASSAAFVADAQLTGQGGGALVGDTRVPTSLTPGTYDIKVSCDGGDGRVTGTVTVGQQGGPGASVPASPVAPVHAGGGGTAHLASVDARSTGPGTRQAVIGLVLASVAAVAVAVRSARRGRDSRD
ncbi:hypothetical protein [Streptomyces sp. NBC_01236]|uniref:hypothetical protein n=1 Tax=Streptomyces sp. NBC_01236 TaxID=2903789 RepID=UPI002E143F36|nr:hypothetical protein OG324_18345 [Streptomyces sp. NBC_01236]